MQVRRPPRTILRAVSSELIFILVGGLLGLGVELLIWQMEWLWHEKTDPKRDPRNTRPPF